MIKLMTILCLLNAHFAFACVTFNPSTGTYTVDTSGDVSSPEEAYGIQDNAGSICLVPGQSL